MRKFGTALIVGLTVSAVSVSTQQASDPQGDKKPATLSTDRVFASEAGLILNPVKPDKTDDFEMVIGRLHEALAKSSDPMRQKQAAGWKVYKAAETVQNGAVPYVF